MLFYVRSAGTALSQDYSWVDEGEQTADVDIPVLSDAAAESRFIWKSTREGIYILYHGCADGNRVDLYNRPLRNDLLIKGVWDEAEKLFTCFANILLNQTEFECVLNKSVTNTDDNEKTGFCVDFQKLMVFCTRAVPKVESRGLNRFLCEKNSKESRENLLAEMRGILRERACRTVLVGGDLSADSLRQSRPDRALSDSIDSSFFCVVNQKSTPEYRQVKRVIGTAVAVGGVATLVFALSRRKK